ncbi:hypothetical protein [Gryllotalpicola sp.]|uniref:hypothetical protein n=1 Tax=Gryllotalpicola sp. TaxID=1932787 RepID=UPI0026348C43|nr:hypothetical protein [Gryllotalpicola sp.]
MRIKQALKAEGRSQRWVAAQIGMSEATFRRKLADDSFTATQFVQIASALKIDVASLHDFNSADAKAAA